MPFRSRKAGLVISPEARETLATMSRSRSVPAAKVQRAEILLAFSKMARSFLRGIRVASKEELRERIERYLAEVNSEPVVFRWSHRIQDKAEHWAKGGNPFFEGSYSDFLGILPFAVLMVILYMVGRELWLAGKKTA